MVVVVVVTVVANDEVAVEETRETEVVVLSIGSHGGSDCGVADFSNK